MADVKIPRTLLDMLIEYHNPSSPRYLDPTLQRGIQVQLAEKVRRMAIHEANSAVYHDGDGYVRQKYRPPAPAPAPARRQDRHLDLDDAPDDGLSWDPTSMPL